MLVPHHRHDLTDRQWSLLEPHPPDQAENWDGIARDSRHFVNVVVLWIFCIGAP